MSSQKTTHICLALTDELWGIFPELFGEKIPREIESALYFYSIAAQSNPALGALLNATFGSLTELLLYTMALFKQGDTENRCFTELVKSGFIGKYMLDSWWQPEW